jgi:hypothetical protein
MSRLGDIDRFYDLLKNLERRMGGCRQLATCNGRMVWPRRGVYFFHEPPGHSGSSTGGRVVRVGTHAITSQSRATLWQRLSQHRGAAGHRGGSHRASIFRKLVGEALICRDGVCVSTWGRGNSPGAAARALNLERGAVLNGERELEIAVSRYIGALPLLCLPMEEADGGARAHIERNAIGLLSNLEQEQIDPSFATWLGAHSERGHVRCSGLWNDEHVDVTYDPAFLDELERRIALARSTASPSS